MKRHIVTGIAAAIASATLGNALAANDFDYCLVCHGNNANGNVAIRAPKISGVEPWYIARQLDSFVSGQRGTMPADAPGHEMGPIGMRLKQEGQTDAAVQFIGSLQSRPPAATIQGNVARGRELYAACSACHGASGEGNSTMQAPALAQRSDWYLVTQLDNFRQGLRGADTRDSYGAQMRAVAAVLPDDKAVTDVVAFINTLRP